MATDNDVIKKELEGIRDERRTHANTAQRIGNALLSLLGRVENVGGNFLRKDVPDTAHKVIRFMEGLKLGDGEKGLDAKGGAVLSDVVVDRVHDAKSTPSDRVLVGAQGFDLYMGEDGKSHMYVDYLVARTKFFAASAEVRKVSYSGGTTVFSNAGSTIAKVTYVFDASGERVVAYKCYALADDGTTRTMNWWHVGMMALCQTFNVKAGESESLQNRYYWRMVIGVGQEVLEDSKLYDYVILSNVREFEGGEAMLPSVGVRVLADEGGRVLRWGGVAVATAYDDELVSMADLFVKQEGRTTDDGGKEIAQRVFYGYEPAAGGGEPDAPAAGDVIVQVGDQIRWKSRGNVIKLSTSTEDNATDTAPAITMYHQIGALWETGAKDSAGQPVRNPYQWKEVTCVISPEEVMLNANRFKLFTGSPENVLEPYAVTYELVPTSRTLVRHDDGTTTPNHFGVEIIKHVGSSKTVLGAAEYDVRAEVVYDDGAEDTMSGLAGLYESVLRHVKSLKLVAYATGSTDVLASCDIAVIRDGKPGADGADGNPGTDGANGAEGKPGKDATVIVINPSVLSVDTKKDSGSNPYVDCSGEAVKATVRIERNGVSIVNECDGYAVVDKMGCSAHIADGGTSRMRIVVDSITRDEYVVGSTKRYIPRTTATATVRIHCATNNSYYYATLTVNVNVSGLWSELTITSEKLSSKYSEISNSVKDMKNELTQYDSKIEQTAREIALKVSQTAVGRKNLLVGSALRRQGEGVRIGTQEGGGIDMLNGVNGVNCAHVISAGMDSYSGLFWWPITPDLTKCIKIEKNKKYTASVWVKSDRLDPLVRIEIKWAENATGTRLPEGFSESFQIKNTNEWQFCSFTFDTGNTKYDYIECNFWVRSKEDGINTHAWFCQPMLVEGDEYTGWSLSKEDADYIGGNLLDNTDTLQTGGNLEYATGNLYTDANSYKGFPTRQVNAINSSVYIDVVQWNFENSDVLVKGQDYMFSFWAKGNKGGALSCFLYGSQSAGAVFVEKENGMDYNQAATIDGNAPISIDEDYVWRKYCVHWRICSDDKPKYVMIRCYKGTDMYVSQPKLEFGATMTEYRATKTDYVEDKSLAGKLLETGIDIVNKQLTLTANKTLIRTNDGRQVALFGKDGLNAALVRAERLETQGAEAAVKIENGMIAVLGRAGVPNIKFGVNSDGYAVMEYYDNAGNLLYDLGPAGLAKIKAQAASMLYSEWIAVSGTNLATPYIKKKTYTSSKGSYSLDFNVASTEANDRLLFGKYAQPGTLVSTNLGFNQLTHLYLYSAPRVNGEIVADRDSRRGLGTLELTKAADGVYFTRESPLAANGNLTNIATGPYIPADAKIKDNMQGDILLLDGTEVMTLPRCYFSGWMKQDKLTAYLKPVITKLKIFSWQEKQISANGGLTPPIQQ